jgi:hypothetical protein
MVEIEVVGFDFQTKKNLEEHLYSFLLELLHLGLKDFALLDLKLHLQFQH